MANVSYALYAKKSFKYQSNLNRHAKGEYGKSVDKNIDFEFEENSVYIKSPSIHEGPQRKKATIIHQSGIRN